MAPLTLSRPGVPALGLDQQLVVAKKPVATNDEVASILKGLQLDRKFFANRLNTSCTKDLETADEEAVEDLSGTAGAVVSRRVDRMKTKAVKRNNQARVANRKNTDFDVYLGESLMPVLAQALDSLCRQVNRMQEQGDSLDPKVRARFNPLTWLAQQMLRRHPKTSKTPRRQAIYANFRDWSDLERGRREMLRRREIVQDVFGGFVLRGVVQKSDLPHVVNAIDDTFRLDGILTNNEVLQRALNSSEPEKPSSPDGKQPRRTQEDFFKDGGWTWPKFWGRFANVILTSDIVPFSLIQRGIELQQKQALLQTEAADARKKEEEDRKQMAADQRRRSEEYLALHGAMRADEHITAILDAGKVLTGDDVRPGDAGYEFEVPPNGQHVTLLFKLLILLGFESLDKTKDKPRTPSPGGPALPDGKAQLSTGAESAAPAAAEAGERWWDDALASAWTTLQEIQRSEITDGVVEQEVLAQVLVPPAGYILLRNKIIEELENREDHDGGINLRLQTKGEVDSVNVGSVSKKPSIDTLCQRLGITMSRMEWLHRLFESFLTPDEKDPQTIPVCLYPECPAAIKKVQMRQLMKELRPSMEEVEFEMRFRRIDTDLSNMVEFDEFVTWVREDEVRVAGAEPLQKMSFEELSVVYGESIELIKYLYDQFQDQFPEGEKDDYPKNPKSLPKTAVRALISSLTPDMPDAEFETQFQMTTFSKKDTLEFDEFLEVIPMDLLPDEVKDAAEPMSP